ncbi:hypothetical protein [Embleya sp. NPDC059259]|uniref:hypothetical protein n=1 Tax=unclassified Embleya TaxID=2699296 RepID=UPI00367F4D18
MAQITEYRRYSTIHLSDDGSGRPGLAAASGWWDVMIGIMQRPEYRKTEIGSLAQRELMHLVLLRMVVHPVQAWSDVPSIAERRTPEQAGPRREGVVRGSRFRDGVHDNGVVHRVACADVA